MTKSTKNYDMFKRRDDNRANGIDETHMSILMDSINKKNMLHLNPIIINSNFEVVSGQHRLEAAKRMDLLIYYDMDKEAQPEDMLLFGISRRWTMADILNFYVKNMRDEYIKLNDFINKIQLPLRIVGPMCAVSHGIDGKAFKMGDYKFKCKYEEDEIEKAKDIIESIRKSCTYFAYTSTSKFWSALMSLVAHPDYNHERALVNVSKFVYRLGAKATQREYTKMIVDLYNFKHSKRIDISELMESKDDE